jgi:hypothetical protein
MGLLAPAQQAHPLRQKCAGAVTGAARSLRNRKVEDHTSPGTIQTVWHLGHRYDDRNV